MSELNVRPLNPEDIYSGDLTGTIVFRAWPRGSGHDPEMPTAGDYMIVLDAHYLVTRTNIRCEGGRNVAHAIYVPPERVPAPKTAELDETPFHASNLRSDIGYDEDEDGSVDLLIDYKNALEGTVDSVETIIRAREGMSLDDWLAKHTG